MTKGAINDKAWTALYTHIYNPNSPIVIKLRLFYIENCDHVRDNVRPAVVGKSKNPGKEDSDRGPLAAERCDFGSTNIVTTIFMWDMQILSSVSGFKLIFKIYELVVTENNSQE